MHDSTIRRYSSAARLSVLNIVEDGAGDATQIAAAWRARRRSTPDDHIERQARVIGQLLWQLERLAWIRRSDDGLVLTNLGRRALAISRQGSGVE